MCPRYPRYLPQMTTLCITLLKKLLLKRCNQGVTDSGLICSFYFSLGKGCKTWISYNLLKDFLPSAETLQSGFSGYLSPVPWRTGQHQGQRMSVPQVRSWAVAKTHRVDQGWQQAGALQGSVGGVWREDWGFSGIRRARETQSQGRGKTILRRLWCQIAGASHSRAV